ncbi:hypothetical protein FDP41_008266 [Naegleria fowleri]|uniref:Kinesin-like protein n=1 Tax=Naegleria fowleri TaxID=5763 RepID=A0A6A5BFI0_NAEFO|nr:uncharacterized protein FDP41_008266 [Naegleria fowleri]KAF0973562.1 hypothetical protein FDP41_008266 [Naegleria fowleri]CAG4709196.1 unnamed protein product [Naegleria fowleri]
MVHTPVQVCVRTRPTAFFAQDVIVLDESKKTIDIKNKGRINAKQNSVNYLETKREDYSFKFDKTLHNVSQDTVFNECAAEITQAFLEGYNGTVMAYGQTGSGKTYTMIGAPNNYKNRGLIPRVIQQVFADMSNYPEKSFTLRVSYMEIYNEQLFDLLSDISDAQLEKANSDTYEDNMVIMEDNKGNIMVRGLKCHIVNSEEEALSMLFEGETNRAICEHQLNKASTRSHCIFTLYLEARSRVESEGQVVLSKLNLVDLAGSERVSKTHSSGIVLTEAKYINKSLSFLEQVVIALGNPSREHIPYRQSKLTYFLKDSLGGNCKTLMIANIWGEEQHLEETVSTLKFATRMMRVSNEATINVHMNPDALIKKYEKEIKELKQELSMHDQLRGINQANYDPYTEEQKIELRREIRSYVNGEIEELEIKNIRRIKEIFNQFKLMLKEASSMSEQESIINTSTAREKQQSAPPSNFAGKIHEEKMYDENGVGEVENKSGFGVGEAKPNAEFQKRTKKAAVPVSARDNERSMNVSTSQNSLPETDRPKKIKMSRNDAFEEYKRTEGKALHENIKENSQTLKDKKSLFRIVTQRLNDTKAEIDDFKAKIEKKQIENAHLGDDIVDEEELRWFQIIKEKKEVYKQVFEDRKMLKSEMDYIEKALENLRQTLIANFQSFYDDNYQDPAEEQKPPLSSRSSRKGVEEEAKEDVLDEGEKFEKLWYNKLQQEDPESLNYYMAYKKAGKAKKATNRKF